MAEPEGPTVIRRLLGMQLRRLRVAKGLSVAEAARVIRGSESKINRIELGRSAIKEIDVLDLLTCYGVDPAERDQLLTLAEQSNRPGWWHNFNDILPHWFVSYIGMEESAKSLRLYEPTFIPGLLQTPEYASAVLTLGDLPPIEADRHVLLRKERQRRFLDGQLRLWAIVDETALRRVVGSPAIMVRQLRYLADLSDRRDLTLQVTPLRAGAVAASGPFTIMRFAERDMPDVVYVEHLTNALYLDKRADVDQYLLTMERLAVASAMPEQSRPIIDRIISEMEDGER